MNLDPSMDIYVTASVKSECHMISQNRNIQEEEKKIASKVNAFKKASLVTKHGRSFAKLLTSTFNLLRDTKTSEDPSNPLLQFLLYLSTDTIKEDFYHIGGNISELSNQKKRTVAEEIVQN